MNMDKRYCQNRERKRKRTIVPSPVEYETISPTQEQRQFKLRRFLDDVNKFIPQKEDFPDKKIVLKRNSSNQEKRAVKKVTIPEPTLKRGLYQNGIQTKFYTRGGFTNKEMTARLDENMRHIISLGNKNQCTHCKGQINKRSGLGSPKWDMEPKRPSALVPSFTRSSPSCEDVHLSPSPYSGHAERQSAKGVQELQSSCRVAGVVHGTTNFRGSKSLSELDKELYPLFTRVVSVSCSQTKSVLFKNQSYVSSVKRKLLDIYINGMESRKQKENCLLEHHKATRSVGTSPLLFSSKSHLPPQKSTEQPFKLNPSKFRFQSTMDFLEEEIGPSSTSTSKQMILSPQCSQPFIESRQLQQSLLSPPVVSYQRAPAPQQSTMYVPKLAKHVHEPFLPSSTPVMSLNNFRQKVMDGRGDGFKFNFFNSFFPPIEEEEDSPDFRYYPTNIF